MGPIELPPYENFFDEFYFFFSVQGRGKNAFSVPHGSRTRLSVHVQPAASPRTLRATRAAHHLRTQGIIPYYPLYKCSLSVTRI